MTERTPDSQRLRPHPEHRFAPEQIQIDLPAAIERLRTESPAGEAGHRQETLYRNCGSTVALFLFERFTNLPEHKTRGVVIIHALSGRLKVDAAGQVHELGAGQMLVLAPNVPHSVAAEEESEMLLSVHLAMDQQSTPD
ncbi:MAG TPA: cupin domain-containing protein [Tepidisphaeraceae bacterium]|nr:cupin domain-containing protein [Tepidisphaeraceae bacterium]